NPSAQSLLEVLGHPQSIRHNRQCGIHGPTRDKEATVNDVKIIEIVRLAIEVERGPPGDVAEPNGAALVRGASFCDALAEIKRSRKHIRMTVQRREHLLELGHQAAMPLHVVFG